MMILIYHNQLFDSDGAVGSRDGSGENNRNPFAGAEGGAR
jgi:hypothetical protein